MTSYNIIQELILSQITVSQGLMPAKYQYKAFLSKDSYHWICHELTYYEDLSSLPDYRIIDCVVNILVRKPFAGAYDGGGIVCTLL